MSRLPQAATDAIIPALLLDIIGDPATNPKGWPFRVLSHVADIGSGLTKGRKLNGQETIATPYLRVANVQDGYLDLAEIKTIEATAADLEKCAFRAGDILMTEGGDADKLGRCAIWRDVVDGCLHQNHIFRASKSALIYCLTTRGLHSKRRGKVILLAGRETNDGDCFN